MSATGRDYPRDDDADDAFGVYVHWPFCTSICPYCDFNVARDRGHDEGRWRDALRAGMDAFAAMAPRRALVSIFFGGGTPSLAPPATIAALVDHARALWPPRGEVEITLEANPTQAEAARFEAFAQAGVNRLSLGVQSLDDAALAFLKRNHDAAQAQAATRLALGIFPRVSIDLIYARPGLPDDQWANELARALDLGAGHLSPYQLTIEDGTAFGRQVAKRRWAPLDEAAAARQFDLTQAICARAGLPAYEISNHARTGEASRHNLGYWRQRDYAGVGPGAHGRIARDGARAATVGVPDPARWLADIEAGGTGLAETETLSAEAMLIEKYAMGLRAADGVVMSAGEAARLAPAIAALEQDGLISRDGARLVATTDGRRLLDHALQRLLA